MANCLNQLVWSPVYRVREDRIKTGDNIITPLDWGKIYSIIAGSGTYPIGRYAVGKTCDVIASAGATGTRVFGLELRPATRTASCTRRPGLTKD